jgi:hypothetical protein
MMVGAELGVSSYPSIESALAFFMFSLARLSFPHFLSQDVFFFRKKKEKNQALG